MIKRFVVGAIVQLATLTFILFTLNVILLYKVLPNAYSAGPWWASYIFLFTVSLLTILGVTSKYRKDKTAAGRTYFLFVFLKLFGSIAFLSPWIVTKTEFSTPFAHQFLCLFFILLFVEVRLLVNLLSGRFDENDKNDKNQ